MATTTQHQQAPVGTGGAEGTRAAPDHDDQPIAARLTTEQVWHQLAKASFAVLSHVTPAGEPRSSGVVYKTVGQQLYIATAPDSWKVLKELASLLPEERQASAAVIEVIPEGSFVTYGVEISLTQMRDPAALMHACR
jgi:hypothetical protein